MVLYRVEVISAARRNSRSTGQYAAANTRTVESTLLPTPTRQQQADGYIKVGC